MEERECSDVNDNVSWCCPQYYILKTIKEGSFFSTCRHGNTL